MKSGKRIALLLAALLLAAVLGGCETMKPDHVTLLVRGTLDEFYLGQFDESFLQLVSSTRDEAEIIYRDGLASEAIRFAHYFNIEHLDVNRDLETEVEKLCGELLAKAKYTVGEPVQQTESVYTVSVTVEPVDFFRLVMADFRVVNDRYNQEFGSQDTSEMSAEEYSRFLVDADAGWTRAILDLCREKLSSLGYKEPETVVVHVEKGADGAWSIVDDNIYYINQLILDYPAVG